MATPPLPNTSADITPDSQGAAAQEPEREREADKNKINIDTPEDWRASFREGIILHQKYLKRELDPELLAAFDEDEQYFIEMSKADLLSVLSKSEEKKVISKNDATALRHRCTTNNWVLTGDEPTEMRCTDAFEKKLLGWGSLSTKKDFKPDKYHVMDLQSNIRMVLLKPYSNPNK